MNRIIKSGSENKEHSVKSVEYISLDEDQPLFSNYADIIQATPSRRMSEVKRQMEMLMGEAKGRAEDVLQEADAEAIGIKERAFQSGYQSGWETAVKEIQMATDSIFRTFRKGLDDIVSLKDSILDQSEDDIVQLSTAIAKKLVCKELRQHPDTIVSIVKEAIKLVRSRDEIVIRIHPEDCDILKQHLSEMVEQLNEGKAGPQQDVPIRIEEDPSLTPGGCIVETDTGLIDMSFEARMESIDQMGS